MIIHQGTRKSGHCRHEQGDFARPRCGVAHSHVLPVQAADVHITVVCAGLLCRGSHSLETMCLLLALKLEHPRNVHLIRGNHEAADINALFGFRCARTHGLLLP